MTRSSRSAARSGRPPRETTAATRHAARFFHDARPRVGGRRHFAADIVPVEVDQLTMENARGIKTSVAGAWLAQIEITEELAGAVALSQNRVQQRPPTSTWSRSSPVSDRSPVAPRPAIAMAALKSPCNVVT